MVIAKVDLSGTINAQMARQYRDIFSYVENSNKVKGVILKINSGGGDAAASEILMESVKKIKRNKPIFSVVEGLGASGAYWVASASSRIYAMKTSITGSIGIIGINPNVKELLNKIGVRVDIVKMGEYKDMMSQFTESDAVAKEKYMDILEHSYSVFKSSVAENRKLKPEDMEKIATGEIFSSLSALNLGLIDKIGNYEDALGDMMKSFGLSGKVRVYAPRKTLIERMVTSSMISSLLSRLFNM